jgi:hypothetical protein
LDSSMISRRHGGNSADCFRVIQDETHTNNF